MGIHLGPPPASHPSPLSEERNPLLPDPSTDPAVSRCIGCKREFTADQFIALGDRDGVTICSHCGQEVVFL